MYTYEERIFQKLAETGLKEFSVEMIKQAMHEVEGEDAEIQYQEYLKSEEARCHEEAQWRADENTLDRIERSQLEAETQPTSWEEIEEDLSTFPELQDNHDMEMEM